MRVGRSYLGKIVEVTWRDPTGTSRRVKLSKAPRGMAALSSWKERGVIDDITDGVIRIVHSSGEDPPGDPDPEPEIFCTWVPEALIETIQVLEAAKTAGEEAGDGGSSG